MKLIKIITTFLLLFIIGIFTSYAGVKYNNWADNFMKTFEQTDAKFKFYNIKINCVVSDITNKNQIENICESIVNYLNLNTNKIKWREENSEGFKICAQIQDNSYSVSFTAIKKNNKEYYIIVDILNNKVYKNIVDIYAILKNSLDKFSYQAEIYTCIAGEYSKKLQIDKYNDILDEILYNMNAEVIEKVQEENFLSITAYSKVLKENYLECFGNKINLNIGIRYSEDDERTLIYIATPIIKLDY